MNASGVDTELYESNGMKTSMAPLTIPSIMHVATGTSAIHWWGNPG